MYLFDTHVHTAEVSPCGNITAKETVSLYKKAGYSGICITDHYRKDIFDAWNGVSWEQAVERFLEGYHKALAYGSRCGLDILLGAEISFNHSPNDYLLFGLTEQFLYSYPKLYDYDAKAFHSLAKEHDILIFQAHPFRPWLTRENPRYLDGVEIVNGNLRHNSRNDLALDFANKNHLCMSAGSDCHELEDIGRSGIITDNRIETIDMLKQQLKEGKAKIIPANDPQNVSKV